MMAKNLQIEWRGQSPATQSAADADGWIDCEWDIRPNADFYATVVLEVGAMAEPFWCVPAIFWGDNQQDTTGFYYPRFDPQCRTPARFESASWEFDAWRAAQPVTAVHDGAGWTVLEVAPYADAAGERLKASVGFQYVDGVAYLVASVPPQERPYRNVGNDYSAPIEARYQATQSTSLRWKVRIRRIEGDFAVLLDLLQENYHAAPGIDAPADTSDYARATRNALMRWHYNPDGHYFRYTAAFDRVGQQIAEGSKASLDRHEMPLGWVNGWPVFEALIEWSVRHADTDVMDAVSNTWQALQDAGLRSPSGFWWTRYAPKRSEAGTIFDSKTETGFDANWMPDPEHLHMRTLGDAVLRAVRSLRLHGAAIPFADDLQAQVVEQAERVAAMARRQWPLPLSVHAQTGDAAGLEGTASMIWISVWCELAQMGLWQDTDLIREGLDFYRDNVVSGQLNGAPEDVGACVTSEDIYIAIIAYLDAYELLGQADDLETTIASARWLYLWQKSFKHEFDKRTLIGAYDLDSRGGQFASFKNNHLHIYGLDADRSLRRLAEITGDGRWQQMADDHWAFSAQLTPLIDGQFNGYEGMVTEQFYFVDWSGLGNSVRLYEDDARRSDYDVTPYGKNHGNLAGFSHGWCTAFVLRVALERDALL